MTFVSGSGAHLFTATGERWLDAGASHALLGHGDPRVAQAMAQQLARGPDDGLAEKLKQRLRGLLPAELSQVYLTSCASEACELALRLARAHRPGKDVIALEDASYGLTTSLVNMSPAHGDRLKFWAQAASRRDPGDVANRAGGIRSSGRGLCGFFAEGVFPDGYLAEAHAHVSAAGGVNVAIETQTGLGRLGTHVWEFARQGAIPDIVVIGEPLANGLPLGAVAARADLAAPFETGTAHAALCAAALAVLDAVGEDDTVVDWSGLPVRGAGRCYEIDVPDGPAIVRKLRERRILIAARGNTLLFRPPLAFSASDAGEFQGALRAGVGL